MAEAKTLREFQVRIDKQGTSGTIHIADDAGGLLELAASREQLDVIADELNRLLDKTEAADEV